MKEPAVSHSDWIACELRRRYEQRLLRADKQETFLQFREDTMTEQSITSGSADVTSKPRGLSEEEARQRLSRDGPNAIPEEHVNKAKLLLEKLWGPVPWLLEAAVLLEVILGNYAQAIVIAILVALDAILAFREEGSAQEALQLLRQRLSVRARVMRDGCWKEVDAAELVVGDFVHIRQGDIVPADMDLSEGTVSLDQSALTGESLAVTAVKGQPAYSGSIVVRGEASGEVTATGTSTYFGRTAELVSTARSPGRLEQLIFGFVRALLLLDILLVAAVLADGFVRHLTWDQLLPFAVILVVAAVPVALPTTFTLASALGSRELANKGVLVTRLAAIEEAASMEVLCTDKTGTITENRLVVERILPWGNVSEDTVLKAAMAASDEATQDPLDLAILEAGLSRQLTPPDERKHFVPFDPATKRSEAVIIDDGSEVHAIKGAPQVIAELSSVPQEEIYESVAKLANTGARVLGVAQGIEDKPMSFLGMIAMADPPRSDSSKLVGDLKNLGVRVVMVTGDGVATARAIAKSVGIGERTCKADILRNHDGPLGAGSSSETNGHHLLHGTANSRERTEEDDQCCDVYAEVLPEDKLLLIERLQRANLVVGMTGDGVNDAPALRKADVGVAVASATDVAKAAASLVLTTPGLDNLVSGVEVSRRIHERMLTYTLNKIIKTLQVSIFLSIGLLAMGKFVTTPLLVVLLLLANNFATMSLATDRVGTPQFPERWTVRSLVLASLGLAIPIIALSFAVWFIGAEGLGLHTAQLQTLTFIWLVTSAQATIYSVRERHHFWNSAPSGWLAASSIGDLLVVTVMAWRGWLMTPIGPEALGVGVGMGVLFLLLGDSMKNWIFRITGLQH